MTRWNSIEIIAGADAAPTLVFASGDDIHAPEALRGRVASIIKAAGFEGKPGRWLDIVGEGEAGGRVVVVAVGAADSDDRWRHAGGHAVEAIRGLGLAAARLPAAAELGLGDALADVIEGVLLHGFRLDQRRREPVPGQFASTLLIADADAALADRARRRADPVNRVRAWVEQPANLLTPAVLADEAEAALAPLGVRVRQLGPAELEALGAGGILAVAAGSANEPRLTIAEWRGAPDREGWDAAFVGKGLTFDAGGLNLKPRPGIAKMKFDMAGGAAVLGAVERLALRKAPVNIVAIVPMCENVIDGKSYRPGDVITSLSGLTIDVQDTDAEGRIVLADGVTYAAREYDPAYIVDVATLTGAIMGVLHEEFAGLFTSDDALAESLTRAGADVREPLWRLPLVAAQDYLVESPVADVANLGAPGWFGAGQGSPVAGAKFIEKFAHGRRWAHLDIAGTGWATRRSSRGGPGATGFGVALLDRWAGLIEKEGR
ncbi:leucyl aminopeptidase family protein [Sphingopyxis panaciterrae]